MADDESDASLAEATGLATVAAIIGKGGAMECSRGALDGRDNTLNSTSTACRRASPMAASQRSLRSCGNPSIVGSKVIVIPETDPAKSCTSPYNHVVSDCGTQGISLAQVGMTCRVGHSAIEALSVWCHSSAISLATVV
jgi:hypothetical protein